PQRRRAGPDRRVDTRLDALPHGCLTFFRRGLSHQAPACFSSAPIASTLPPVTNPPARQAEALSRLPFRSLAKDRQTIVAPIRGFHVALRRGMSRITLSALPSLDFLPSSRRVHLSRRGRLPVLSSE